jgi:hypothetical protein
MSLLCLLLQLFMHNVAFSLFTLLALIFSYGKHPVNDGKHPVIASFALVASFV